MSRQASVAVLGAGSLGGLFAAHFARAGHRVWAIRRSPEHVAAIHRVGLSVDGPDGSWTAPVAATTDPLDAGPCDLVVLATKSHQVAAVEEVLPRLLAPGGRVVTVQNGLGTAERLVPRLGPRRLIVGIAEGFGAATVGPGRVAHNAMRWIKLANYGRGVTPGLTEVAQLWREAGFRVAVLDRADQAVWEKLLCNAAFGGVSVLTGGTLGEIMASPTAWRLAVSCAREVHAVGRAAGVAFQVDDPAAHVADFARSMPRARTSMLQDHVAGRRSEVDAIHGAVVEAAGRLGVEAPYNELVHQLVRALEGRSAWPVESPLHPLIISRPSWIGSF